MADNDKVKVPFVRKIRIKHAPKYFFHKTPNRGGYEMRKKIKQRYEDLYKQNLSLLIKDEKEMDRIEQKIDKRHMDRLGS